MTTIEIAKQTRERGQFAINQIDGGHRSEAAFMDVLAYARQLEAANARHVMHHIESICEVCGHTKGEDGCPHCLRAELEALQRINDQNAHDFKQLRDALKCDGSDLPQLLAAVEALQKEAEELRETLETNREAFEIGVKWKRNSALEEWFPITAEELASLRAQNQTLREALSVAINTIEQALAQSQEGKL